MENGARLDRRKRWGNERTRSGLCRYGEEGVRVAVKEKGKNGAGLIGCGLWGGGDVAYYWT